MEREIKFRAWDKRTKEMIPNVQNNTPNDSFSDFLHYDCYEVMQFTGLLDKNGKEIYEGDVIQFNTWTKSNVREVVKFEDGAFMPFFDSHYCDDEQGDHFSGDDPFEVIGNIYENEDLLK